MGWEIVAAAIGVAFVVLIGTMILAIRIEARRAAELKQAKQEIADMQLREAKHEMVTELSPEQRRVLVRSMQ